MFNWMLIFVVGSWANAHKNRLDMNIPGVLYNFKVEPQNLATLLVKWNWNSNNNEIAYFQMSHSYQQDNETKTIYSSFVPGNVISSYILRNVEPHKMYEVCITVFIRDSPKSRANRPRNNTEHLQTTNKSVILNPNRICLISLTKANHIQAIVSCLIGVVVALLLIGLIIILCRMHQRWTKTKCIKTELKGSNRDYYERHRNSETTPPTDDFSGFDDCETSCTSQMIAESLAWSPSSSLNSQLNLNILRSKSNLYNHSSSHPSSTPRIMEEDPFYEAFVDKTPDSNNNDIQSQSNLRNPESTVMQHILSPYFGTASTPSLNSNCCEPVGMANYVQTDSILSNSRCGCDEKTPSFVYLKENSNSDLVLQLVDEV